MEWNGVPKVNIQSELFEVKNERENVKFHIGTLWEKNYEFIRITYY